MLKSNSFWIIEIQSHRIKIQKKNRLLFFSHTIEFQSISCIAKARYFAELQLKELYIISDPNKKIHEL